MLEQTFAATQIGFPILSILIFLPLVGAMLIWMLKSDELLVRIAGIAVTGIELALTVWLLFAFKTHTAAMQFVEQVDWIPAIGVSYHLGIDGISVLFLGVTALLSLLTMLFSWDLAIEKIKGYVMALLALQATVMGILVSLDLVLFFVFWELMLIPSYFLIKLWGAGKIREHAALKYVLYTLTGSMLMLVGIIILDLNYQEVNGIHSFDLLALLTAPMSADKQLLVFLLLFFGFAAKAPIFPFHAWLADALVSGPVAVSVALAGIKLGTYGFIRFSIPLLPDASRALLVPLSVLALVGIIYGAFVALAQSDLRRLLAFSSISHLGFVVLGLFTLNFHGLQGGLLQMINLAFTTAGLFFIAGFLYSRGLQDDLTRYGGLVTPMPALAGFFIVIGLASVGFPGTNGFVGEFLILLGAFKAHWAFGAVGVLGVILGLAYILWYYERAMLAPPQETVIRDHRGNERPVSTLRDLNPREWVIATSLTIMIFWIGLYPAPFFDMMDASVQAVVDRVDHSTRFAMSSVSRGALP
jgi:NADH-quinone oxidoreductase subunit M